VERKSFRDMDCSVAQCLEIVGEWWTLLIVRDLFLGIRRFEDLQHRLSISRNILTDRLSGLVDAGIIERRQYQDRPARYEYRLTGAGRELWPIITSLRQWGDRYAAPDGPRLRLRHKGCGEVAEPTLRCSACGEAVEARDYEVLPGPGDPTGQMIPPRRRATLEA
jgi:DNA-binding HxlR family transcriptional regulator